MKNKLKMGFEYEITNISPNGDILEKQNLRNILVNEGITYFLESFFLKRSTYLSNYYTYAFMESDYIPQPTDSLTGNNALDLYEVDYNNTLLSQGSYIEDFTLITNNLTLGKDNISIIFGEGHYKFSGYKTLTGVCLFRNNFSKATGSFNIKTLNGLIKNSFLISAARFKTPIQINPGGTVRAKSVFIVLPA